MTGLLRQPLCYRRVDTRIRRRRLSVLSPTAIAYCDRLSDSFGLIAVQLPGNPERSPFVVHDFVGGRRFTITYNPPPLQPGGEWTVYIVDDGHAVKIGITHGYVAARVATLQTGNPRLINTVATVSPATQAVEQHLHAVFGDYSLRGEWFKRVPLLDLAESEGQVAGFGWRHLGPPPGGWDGRRGVVTAGEVVGRRP